MEPGHSVEWPGFFVCARHGHDLEVKVLCGSWPQQPRANRKVTTARLELKEAGSETASRRTGTGYQATPSRASGHVTAKLLWPKRGGVDPAVVRGKSETLTRGDLVSRSKERRRPGGARSQQRS